MSKQKSFANDMSKQKSFADITAERINEETNKHGWQSDITANYINAQIAVNLALLLDVLIAIEENRMKYLRERE